MLLFELRERFSKMLFGFRIHEIDVYTFKIFSAPAHKSYKYAQNDSGRVYHFSPLCKLPHHRVDGRRARGNTADAAEAKKLQFPST